MSKIVLLESGLLGMVTHPRRNADAKAWLGSLLRQRTLVIVPEIADYEVRRELLRAGKPQGIERLDALAAGLGYLPITTRTMRWADELWADARNQGRPTAPDPALDADIILAAQAALLRDDGDEPVVATTNVGHLTRFIDAREWHEIR